MEKVERKTHTGVYLTAVFITIGFFILGIGLGDFFAYQRAGSLEISQKAISAFFDLATLKSDYYSNVSMDYCKIGWDSIWKEKVGIGVILTSLENRLGKTNANVLEQKKLYNEVQIKTLNLVEKVNTQCDYGWEIVLFFYTNSNNDAKGSVKDSETQGYMLDTLYNGNKDNVKIFSFDANIESPGLKALMEQYNVTRLPSVVINGKLYPKLMSNYELVKAIEE